MQIVRLANIDISLIRESTETLKYRRKRLRGLIIKFKGSVKEDWKTMLGYQNKNLPNKHNPILDIEVQLNRKTIFQSSLKALYDLSVMSKNPCSKYIDKNEFSMAGFFDLSNVDTADNNITLYIRGPYLTDFEKGLVTIDKVL